MLHYFNKLYHLIFIKGQRGPSFKSSLSSFMFSETPGIRIKCETYKFCTMYIHKYIVMFHPACDGKR